MGSVVAMRDTVLDRDVAVKTLHPWLLSDTSSVVRFLQEAHLMARLEGRGAPRVIDVGTNPKGLPFIVMELVEGETLSARVLRKGPLPLEEVVTVIAQVCDALAHAHACGVVHRDVKPGNVMVTRTRTGSKLSVKLIDFGLAKVEGAARQTSDIGESFGTPGFMSPEQMRDGHDADARSDIWAVGVLFYRCLTGDNPFPAVMRMSAVDSYVPACARRHDLPSVVDHIIARCLDPSPRQRFTNATELAAAVRSVTTAVTVKINRKDRPPKTASTVKKPLQRGHDAPPTPLKAVHYVLAVGISFLVGVLLVLICL